MAARAAAGLIAAGAVLAAWERSPAASGVQAYLLALGLDSQRAEILSGAAGAALAGAVAALISQPVTAWAAAGAWYVVLVAVPMALRPGVEALPGEHVNHAALTGAAAILATLGFLPGGLGAAAGWACRRVVLAVLDAPHWPREVRLKALATAALLAISVFGLANAPTVLTYGPWSGVLETTSAGSLVGRQVVFSYPSRILGGTRQAVVILPPTYFGKPVRRYPVLYLLHGSPGTMWDWPRAGAGEIAESIHSMGLAPEMVIVSPDGVGPRGGAQDSWADGYVPGDRMESSVLEELIPEIQSHFRVVADQVHRAIGGLSSGGYGAANMALRHPGLFGLAIDLSGDVDPPLNAFGGDLQKRLENDPLVLALRPKPPGASAFFVGWGQDQYASQNMLFAQRLRASGYTVRTGSVTYAHDWDAFRALLWKALEASGRQIGPPLAI